ncbi:hypothetical protein AYI70_g3592 [Smittium culicis]|uniref:Uncharacterized protein n=1 Tax=Smittium culicis TaxID=133412 RepID=A0A1R1Y3C2_9FUNG|nr:hypothetical protein AYI70_g3592 [Smittium culicis]
MQSTQQKSSLKSMAMALLVSLLACHVASAPMNATIGNVRMPAISTTTGLVNGYYVYQNPCHSNHFSFVAALVTQAVSKTFFPSLSRIFRSNVASNTRFVIEGQKSNTQFDVEAMSNSRHPVFFTVAGNYIFAGNGDPMKPDTSVHYQSNPPYLLDDIIVNVKVSIPFTENLYNPEFICWRKV